MKQSTSTKITLFCPSGHRLRGFTELMGKRVRCPRCEREFVFAPSRSDQVSSPDRSNPDRSNPDHLAAVDGASRPLSESRVMHILGDMESNHRQAARPSPPQPPAECRPCPQCDGMVLESRSVCPHCSSYVGVLPSFMQQLQNQADADRRLG